MKKNVFTAILVVLMALSFTACKDKDIDSSKKDSSSNIENSSSADVTTVSDVTTIGGDVTTTGDNVTTIGGDITSAGGNVTTGDINVTSKTITTKKSSSTKINFSFGKSDRWTKDSSDDALYLHYEYSGKSADDDYAELADIDVTSEYIGNYDLDTFTDVLVKDIDKSYTLVESKKTKVGEYDAMKFTAKPSSEDGNITIIVYIIVKDDTAYIINFTAFDLAIDEIIPEFESFIDTFKIG